ncbi:MAG: phosphomannomutase/phosphoglucomutase [Patescibacteria group bacterium]
MNIDQKIFKAYDIRGIYPEQLNEEAAYAIGRGYATLLLKRFPDTKLKVAVGRDMRLSSPALQTKIIQGLLDTGIDVDDIGLVSTPAFYFATSFYGYKNGVQITASHNPKQWNGVKMVINDVMVNGDNGINEVRDLIVNDQLAPLVASKGQLGKRENTTEDMVREQVSNIDLSKIKALKIVIDPANGSGALDMQELFKYLPCEIVQMNFEVDGTFPAHEADPMKPENIKFLCDRVVAEKADLGIGIDGDADRYFFVDETGKNVPQGILRGIMAQIELVEHPGATVAYDIRPGRITLDMINAYGGKPLLTRVGHSYIKEMMVKAGAVFGGESSGHYCYKFPYGTFEAPVVEVTKFLKFISEQNKPVSEIIKPYDIYFHSGEINMELQSREEAFAKIEAVKAMYVDGKINMMDGLSVEYPDFWFNLRPSNTEPLLRLAVEGVSKEIVEQKVVDIKKVLLG